MKADSFVRRVAALKSIPEGATASEIVNSYNEIISEARQLLRVDPVKDAWWNRDVIKPTEGPG